MADVQSILQIFSQAKSGRENWDDHWRQVAELTWPEADEFQTVRTSGEKRHRKVYDPTAALALEKGAAAYESFVAPRGQIFQKFRSDNEELNKLPEVKQFFDDVTERVFKAREASFSGFHGQHNVSLKSLMAFGNQCMFMEPHPLGGIRYKSCHIGSIYIQVDQFGNIDTVFRKFQLTAKAAAQAFPDAIDRMESVRLAANGEDGNPFSKFDFLHVVFPRIEDFDPLRLDSFGMPWASVIVDIPDEEIVSEGGFEEMPYVFSRWSVNPNEIYGRGPGLMMLPANATLQEMERTHLRTGQKIADPPILAYDDGEISAGSDSIDISPGAINWGGVNASGQQLLAPFITGARLDITEAMMEKKRQHIDEAFLVPLFFALLENPQMTATEVIQRVREQAKSLAPTVGRQETEFYGPMARYELQLLFDQGILPQPPQVMQEAEGEYQIVYQNEATQAMQQNVTLGFQRSIEVMAPLAADDPTILKVIDAREAARHVLETNGVPQRFIRSEEQIREIIQQQAEAEAAAQQAAEQAAAADALQKTSVAAKNFSEIPAGNLQ